MKQPGEILDAKESFNFLTSAQRVRVKIAMIEYAQQACERQRELSEEKAQSLFAEQASSTGRLIHPKLVKEEMLTAPSPFTKI